MTTPSDDDLPPADPFVAPDSEFAGYYLASTGVIMGLIKEGQHFNRAIDLEWAIENLDPAGTHVITPFMWHDYVQGEPAPPHLRCNVLFKVIGTMEPTRSTMDISMPNIERLTKVERG